MDYQFAFQFLSDLSGNNNREWFEVNRSRYQEVKVQFEKEVAHFIELIGTVDPDVRNCEPKKSIFRRG